MPLPDMLGRPLRSLRLSLTDRCNLRCQYCMPEEEYTWLPRESFLSFEEIEFLARIFASKGVEKIRLTGGEPLLRPEIPLLISRLRRVAGLVDFALTTNGLLLAEQAKDLAKAGLLRLTVSLDTLKPERFFALTRRNRHADVLRGIAAGADAGFEEFKIDSVILRGVNDDEMVPLLDYGRTVGAEVRFIEYMDVGGATKWSSDKVFSKRDMLMQLTDRLGPIQSLGGPYAAPAERFRTPDGRVFGIIASTTSPFCRACDRSRLTADGMWFLCLYATQGSDLGRPMRAGASVEALSALIETGWRARRDRGAEERLALGERRVPLSADQLRANPHLEMHARGG